ncbi:MAG: coenzyme F430 synthase [Methanoregula sp.]|nr:coenzyme F430 synthase [Methanoregula sp.]
MRVLVLDTIHGGSEIGAAFVQAGHAVDMVDVYRGSTPEAATRAASGSYDLVVAPVHLDPDHPLLFGQAGKVPVISHHEAVRRLLAGHMPHPTIEITGAQGKTTTAHALAALLPGTGVLHTSTGTYLVPGHRLFFKKSITPASVLAAAGKAREAGGWLVAEESLGVTGAGDLAIITSPNDYRCAAGKKSALGEKLASARNCRQILVCPGIIGKVPDHAVRLDDIAKFSGTTCRISVAGRAGSFTSPLLNLPGYRIPLALAGTAALMLGYDPAPLSGFAGVEGRMSVKMIGDVIEVDNANSGTTAKTTVEAARYARACTGVPGITLVIGTVTGDGAVCEGFPAGEITEAIREIRPDRVLWVGEPPAQDKKNPLSRFPFHIDAVCADLAEAKRTALDMTPSGAIVLAVKTWR